MHWRNILKTLEALIKTHLYLLPMSLKVHLFNSLVLPSRVLTTPVGVKANWWPGVICHESLAPEEPNTAWKKMTYSLWVAASSWTLFMLIRRCSYSPLKINSCPIGDRFSDALWSLLSWVQSQPSCWLSSYHCWQSHVGAYKRLRARDLRISYLTWEKVCTFLSKEYLRISTTAPPQ